MPIWAVFMTLIAISPLLATNIFFILDKKKRPCRCQSQDKLPLLFSSFFLLLFSLLGQSTAVLYLLHPNNTEIDLMVPSR
jgi:hypothetical protein